MEGTVSIFGNLPLRKVGHMETKRQLQVAEQLKRHFSQVLQQEGSYIYGDALVTVTGVKVTPDLSLGKIYLSVYNTEDKQGELNLLIDQYPRLKQLFGHRLRKHVRRVPDFAFYLDDTLDEMYRIDAMMDRILDRDRQRDQESE